ncbi:MAG TPA: hypothetical protein VGL89_02320 [Candidatus Koribacter sp.]|jgi:hypothetical protein
MKRVSMACIVLFICVACAAPLHADDPFNTTVDRIAGRVGKRPLRIPFLSALLFFTPARGTHVHLATFEDLDTRLSLHDLESSMQGALGPQWHPFVRVDSKKDHECTLIYARAVGSEMRLMVITAETGEVTVVQVDVPKNLQEKWMNDAGHERHHVTDGNGDGA